VQARGDVTTAAQHLDDRAGAGVAERVDRGLDPHVMPFPVPNTADDGGSPGTSEELRLALRDTFEVLGVDEQEARTSDQLIRFVTEQFPASR
jgi:hypothetical protein